MSAAPPPGSRVHVLLSDGTELYGDVVPAKLRSGRIPIRLWGREETACLDPADVVAIDVIDPSSALILRESARQRDRILGLKKTRVPK